MLRPVVVPNIEKKKIDYVCSCLKTNIQAFNETPSDAPLDVRERGEDFEALVASSHRLL